MTQTSTSRNCPECGASTTPTTYANGTPALVCDACPWQGQQSISTAEVTADLLRNNDMDALRVVRRDGKVYGEDLPSLAFGLGSYEGDYDGFAAYLRTV